MKPSQRFALATAMAAFCTFGLDSAQAGHGGVPASSWAPLAKPAEYLELPPIDIAAYQREDALRGKNEALRYGALIPIEATADEIGTWETLADGAQVWRLALRSPGAKSLAVVFSEYRLPKGGQLFVYDPARTQLLGAFTELENQSNLAFGFFPLAGDALVLEYVEPAQAEFHAALRIGDAIHDYRGVRELLDGKSGAVGDAGACEVDVNCPQGASWQDKKRAIARTLSGGALCTGALLNNTANDGKSYFMTAYHCGGMNAAVFALNYEKSGCGTGSTTNNAVSGSTQKAGNQANDFRLVEITQAIPASYKPYFLGWNRTTSAPPSSCCIHHPQGDVKKISFDNNAPTISSNQWHVSQWDLGVTEPGSSGSPLMRNDGRFIGQLYGGASYCGFPYDDYYGRFDLAWNSVKTFLDPLGSNPTGIDGYDPFGTPPAPPTLNNLAPSSVQALPLGLVTLTGSNLGGITQLDVGTQTLVPPLGFSVVNPTTVTFNAPAPTALGPVSVTATNAAGPSNALTLTYAETSPPALNAGSFALTGASFPWAYGGGAGDLAILGWSPSSTTFPYFGWNVLANFYVLKVQALDALGLGSHSLVIPASAVGVTFYSQVGTLGAGVFEGASSVASSIVLF